VGPFAVAIRVYRVRQADKQERIAVRRCPHDGFGADIAKCLQILASAGNESAAGEFLSLQAEASDLVPFLNGMRSAKVSILAMVIVRFPAETL
jgi:hypothetical protein